MAERLTPVVGGVPDALNVGIGRVVVSYAYLEYQLQLAIRNLTGLGEKEQRLVLREPRAADRLDMIMDLIDVHGLSITIRDGFGAELKRVTSERDAVAHGIWSFDEERGAWFLVRTGGKWGKLEASRSRRSRKIIPKGDPITAAWLEALRTDIIALIGTAKQLRADIANALQASPRKPR